MNQRKVYETPTNESLLVPFWYVKYTIGLVLLYLFVSENTPF